jgi:hypothetical protein
MGGLQEAEFDQRELANLATVAKMFGKWPHEMAFGRNDAPTYVVKPHPDDPTWFAVEPESDIPMAHLIFDLQCALAYANERSKQAAQAEREAKHG